MSDTESVLLSGSDFAQLSQNLTHILQSLPDPSRSHLRTIFRNYFSSFGPQGTHDRMNNRTVSQIFSEYQSKSSGMIVTGEFDGLRYELHEASDDEENPS